MQVHTKDVWLGPAVGIVGVVPPVALAVDTIDDVGVQRLVKVVDPLDLYRALARQELRPFAPVGEICYYIRRSPLAARGHDKAVDNVAGHGQPI